MTGEKITRPVLGQRVTATHRLKRATIQCRDGAFRKWERIDWKVGQYEGIYVGRRTYSDGAAGKPEHGGAYIPINRFEVWLIVENTSKNPIAVLPSDCTLVPSQIAPCVTADTDGAMT